MTRPSIGPPRAPRAPKIVERELPGALNAVAVRRPGVPLVEVRLAFAVGSAQLLKPAETVVLSKSLLAGTDHHDRSELAEAAERLGGRLSSNLERDWFSVGASVLSEHLSELLALLAEVLVGASYPAGEVRGDRARAADESVLALSRPDVIADEALNQRLFSGHPYATGIPHPAALRRVGAARLDELHTTILDRGTAHLVLVGDLQPARALRLAEEAFGEWLDIRRTAKTDLPRLRQPDADATWILDRPGSVQSNLRMGGPAPSRSDPEWPATSLANMVLGGMFTSRLVANLRERHGYSYSPHAAIQHGRAGSSFLLGAEVSTDVTAAALAEVRYELGRIAIDGVSESELESARQYAVGRFTFQTATLAGLSATLATLAVGGMSPGYLASYPAAIVRTTKSSVDEAARRYLAPRDMLTVVVGEADEITGAVSATDEVVVRRAGGR